MTHVGLVAVAFAVNVKHNACFAVSCNTLVLDLKAVGKVNKGP